MRDEIARSARARAVSRGFAHALIGLAFVAWVGSGLYGIASPGIWGHYGFHSAEYTIRARHTLRSGSIIPGNHPGWAEPKTGTYYVHHPILTHQIVTISLWLGGDWDYTARSAALVVSTLSFLLLVLIVRRWWGVWQAALAAWAFVLVPVNVWFSNHIDPGFPSIACLLAFFWFYLRWLETARWRLMLAALFFTFLAGWFEWSPYLLAAPVGLHTLGVAIRRRGRFLWFPLLYTLANIVPFGAHAWIVDSVGHWEESSVGFADRTRSPPYQQFLDQLLALADTMLGREFVVLIGGWFVLLVARIFMRRARHRDLIAVSFLFSVGLYSHVFTSGFFVHAYRILYANVVSALALVDVVMAGGAIVGWLADKVRLRWYGWVNFALRLLARLAILAACYSMVSNARAALDESRKHGGVPKWSRYDPVLDRIRVAKLLRDSSLPGDRVLVHKSWGEMRKEVEWYLDRDVRHDISTLGQLEREDAQDTLVMLAAPKLSSSDRTAFAKLCAKHPITVVSGYAVLDARKSFPRARAYRIESPKPRSALSRYFVGPYAMPRLERDLAAEMDYMLLCGVSMKDEETPRPAMPLTKDVDGLVRYHNYQLLLGDRALATKARAELEKAFAVRRAKPPDGSSEDQLLGATLTSGRVLTVFLVVPPGSALTGTLQIVATQPGKRPKRFDQPLPPLGPELRAGYIYIARQTVLLDAGESVIRIGTGSPEDARALEPPVTPTRPGGEDTVDSAVLEGRVRH